MDRICALMVVHYVLPVKSLPQSCEAAVIGLRTQMRTPQDYQCVTGLGVEEVSSQLECRLSLVRCRGL